jgi:Transposase DDE domain
MNLSRYSFFNERTYRRWFLKSFDFMGFNHGVVGCLPAGDYVAAIDCVVQNKTGKKTYGIGSFWSTIQKRTIRGVEVSCLALVHLKLGQAFSLDGRQTNGKKSEKGSRVDQYVNQLNDLGKEILKYTRYLVADGFYVKQKFISAAIKIGFHVISKLRIDANMMYLYTGEQKRKQGRKKRFDGKFNIHQLDRLKFVKKMNSYLIYEQLVYNMTLQSIIKIVMIVDRKGKKDMLMSTDCELSTEKILNYYAARFQIELLFRDAKQHTGFGHCQSRNKKSLNFHFNLSLSMVNLAKLQILGDNMFKPETVISIDNLKRKKFNEEFINRIISMLDINPNIIKKKSQYQNIINYGTWAA